MMELINDNYCFACGTENPLGLKLKFSCDDEGFHTTFTPPREHQGYKGVLHGGIIATLLDEIMAWALINKGFRVVTVKMEIRFRKPVPTGENLVIRGEMENRQGRFITTKGKITDAKGTILATATGTFAEI
jgi:uncharacterized protein (TIGR00369 family)